MTCDWPKEDVPAVNTREQRKRFTWVDSRKENRKERVGVMKLYMHRYPETKLSVGQSERQTEELLASARVGGLAAPGGPWLRTSSQKSKNIRPWI